MTTDELIAQHLRLRLDVVRHRATPAVSISEVRGRLRRAGLHAALVGELDLRRVLAARLAEALVRSDLGTASKLWGHLTAQELGMARQATETARQAPERPRRSPELTCAPSGSPCPLLAAPSRPTEITP